MEFISSTLLLTLLTVCFCFTGGKRQALLSREIKNAVNERKRKFTAPNTFAGNG